jgi:hypothetical protein
VLLEGIANKIVDEPRVRQPDLPSFTIGIGFAALFARLLEVFRPNIMEIIAGNGSKRLITT